MHKHILYIFLFLLAKLSSLVWIWFLCSVLHKHKSIDYVNSIDFNKVLLHAIKVIRKCQARMQTEQKINATTKKYRKIASKIYRSSNRVCTYMECCLLMSFSFTSLFYLCHFIQFIVYCYDCYYYYCFILSLQTDFKNRSIILSNLL